MNNTSPKNATETASPTTPCHRRGVELFDFESFESPKAVQGRTILEVHHRQQSLPKIDIEPSQAFVDQKQRPPPFPFSVVSPHIFAVPISATRSVFLAVFATATVAITIVIRSPPLFLAWASASAAAYVAVRRPFSVTTAS